MLTTTRLGSVPADPPDRPTVFVVVTARAVIGRTVVNGQMQTMYGDVGGVLMHADGSTGWSHMSSNLDWLVRDLTTSFPDRRAELTERYGDDFDIATIEDWADAPAWLQERNNAWAASQSPNQDEETARA